MFLAGSPINYKCKLQHDVALSSTESELYTAREAAKNVKHMRSAMNHLDFNLFTPTRIYEDNASTIAVSNNERATKRLIHVDLRYFKIIVRVKNVDQILKSTIISDITSDKLNKPLGSILHSRNSDTFLGIQQPLHCEF